MPEYLFVEKKASGMNVNPMETLHSLPQYKAQNPAVRVFFVISGSEEELFLLNHIPIAVTKSSNVILFTGHWLVTGVTCRFRC